jgi:ParB-like chromosome segregation protein Spo0J
MEYHPIASIFPLLDIQEIGAISEDIKKNGLLNPILTYEGKILDGRNRFRACTISGVTPTFTDYQGNDPVNHVLSLNLHRRQLTASQRAAVALESLPHFEEEAKKRYDANVGRPSKESVELVPPISDGHKSRDQAGELVGVNGRYVSEAKRIKEESPETFEKVKAGEISIKGAIKELFVPKMEAATTASKPTSIKLDEAERIWLVAKSHLEKITKNDDSRERVLKEAIAYLEDRISKGK